VSDVAGISTLAGAPPRNKHQLTTGGRWKSLCGINWHQGRCNENNVYIKETPHLQVAYSTGEPVSQIHARISLMVH